MQDVKKLVRMSTEIDPKKTTYLEKSEPLYKLCEFYIIEKQHHTLSRVVNKIDLFKYAN